MRFRGCIPLSVRCGVKVAQDGRFEIGSGLLGLGLTATSKGPADLSTGPDVTHFPVAIGLRLFDLVLHPIAFAFDPDRLGVMQ